MRAPWLVLGLLGTGPAVAGETLVSLGAGVGVAADMRDAASEGQTRFGVAPSLSIPLRVQPLSYLRWRLDVRLDVGWGVDQLTWASEIEGTTVRATDDDSHLAIVGVLEGATGFDVVVPVQGRARPYLGATLGVAGVGVYHALRGSSAVLLDPDQNELGNDGNIDPHTVQAVLTASALAGVTIEVVPSKVELFVEMGYSGAFAGPRALRKTAAELDARREAFAWNPVRASLGVLARL